MQSPVHRAADKVAGVQRRKNREDAWGGAETCTALERMERGRRDPSLGNWWKPHFRDSPGPVHPQG